ncbi:hypothetical protein FQZ97_1029300 [compost metagenome]
MGVTHGHLFLVFALQSAVFVLEFTGGDDLTRFAVFRCSGINHHPFVKYLVVFFSEQPLVNRLHFKEQGISGIEHVYLLHHLAYDHLNVLIRYLHPLLAIHGLGFVYQVLLHRGRPFDAEDISRCNGTV